MTKHYCDCCKKEAKNESCLIPVIIFSEFRQMQGDDFPYETKDICWKCNKEIVMSVSDKYKELEVKQELDYEKDI